MCKNAGCLKCKHVKDIGFDDPWGGHFSVWVCAKITTSKYNPLTGETTTLYGKCEELNTYGDCYEFELVPPTIPKPKKLPWWKMLFRTNKFHVN